MYWMPFGTQNVYYETRFTKSLLFAELPAMAGVCIGCWSHVSSSSNHGLQMKLTCVSAVGPKGDLRFEVVIEVRIEIELIRPRDTSLTALNPPALATLSDVQRTDGIAGAYLDPESVSGIKIEEFSHVDRDFD